MLLRCFPSANEMPRIHGAVRRNILYHDHCSLTGNTQYWPYAPHPASQTDFPVPALPRYDYRDPASTIVG